MYSVIFGEKRKTSEEVLWFLLLLGVCLSNSLVQESLRFWVTSTLHLIFLFFFLGFEFQTRIVTRVEGLRHD